MEKGSFIVITFSIQFSSFSALHYFVQLSWNQAKRKITLLQRKTKCGLKEDIPFDSAIVMSCQWHSKSKNSGVLAFQWKFSSQNLAISLLLFTWLWVGMNACSSRDAGHGGKNLVPVRISWLISGDITFVSVSRGKFPGVNLFFCVPGPGQHTLLVSHINGLELSLVENRTTKIHYQYFQKGAVNTGTQTLSKTTDIYQELLDFDVELDFVAKSVAMSSGNII